jgi:hypothetical protein
MYLIGINKLAMRSAEPNTVRLIAPLISGESGIKARPAR